MVIHNRRIQNATGIQGSITHRAAGIKKAVNTAAPVGFVEILNSKMNDGSRLKFSRHAEMRLKTRNIKLSQAQMERMDKAVKRAEGKGVKESLVVVDNMAFVVGIDSKTVITAMDGSEMKENIFTNIDGAVIA